MKHHVDEMELVFKLKTDILNCRINLLCTDVTLLFAELQKMKTSAFIKDRLIQKIPRIKNDDPLLQSTVKKIEMEISCFERNQELNINQKKSKTTNATNKNSENLDNDSNNSNSSNTRSHSHSRHPSPTRTATASQAPSDTSSLSSSHRDPRSPTAPHSRSPSPANNKNHQKSSNSPPPPLSPGLTTAADNPRRGSVPSYAAATAVTPSQNTISLQLLSAVTLLTKTINDFTLTPKGTGSQPHRGRPTARDGNKTRREQSLDGKKSTEPPPAKQRRTDNQRRSLSPPAPNQQQRSTANPGREKHHK